MRKSPYKTALDKATFADMVEALWQAYYHNEIDLTGVDGNDHPNLLKTAERLLERLRDATSV